MPDIHLRKDHLLACWPALLTALAYALLLSPHHPFPGMGGRELTTLFQVEFLVLHSFLFLAITGGIGWGGWASFPDKSGKTFPMKYVRRFFWGLLAVYLLASFSMGWAGPLYFLGATSATYPVFLGFTSRRSFFRGAPPSVLTTVSGTAAPDPFPDLSAWVQLGARWFLGFVLYMICVSFAGLSQNVDDWRPDAHTYWAGALYFAGLGSVELSGLYDRLAPLEKMVQGIAKEAQSKAKPLP